MGKHGEHNAGCWGDAPSVIIVGAGVSGCACAAALAEAGVQVTLINSAMDRVGLPAYGPDLVAQDGRWERLEEVMNSLPLPLRIVWLGAAARPADGEPVMNVDRRRISIETKRALERIAGVRFRQGFVVELRLLAFDDAPERVQVETVFGEVFEADAVVVAAGLSLGGRTTVGAESVEGGRYGEPASDGLLAALGRLGAQFEDVVLEIGARAPRRHRLAESCSVGGPDNGTYFERRLTPLCAEENGSQWPAGFPPAPHFTGDLLLQSMVMTCGWDSAKAGDGPMSWTPAVSPDGAATAEVYLAPGCPAADQVGGAARTGQNRATGESELVVTRMPVTIRAKATTSLSETGRVTCTARLAPLWVVGRSAGAEDYLESLRSGVRAAADIADVFRGRQERG